MTIHGVRTRGKTTESEQRKRDPTALSGFYLSQGFSGHKRISNDCGPTSLAMVLNILAAIQFDKDIIKRRSGLHFWERIPDFVPAVGGATSPWGLVRAFNIWASELQLPWQAERKSRASRRDILEQLMRGNFISALKVWPVWGAHWVNVVEFSSQKNLVYLLDPNPYLERLPEERKVVAEDWEKFARDWSRVTWWSWPLGLKNELVCYCKE